MWLWAWAREAYSDSGVEDGMRLFVVKMRSHKSKEVSLPCDGMMMCVRVLYGRSKWGCQLHWGSRVEAGKTFDCLRKYADGCRDGKSTLKHACCVAPFHQGDRHSVFRPLAP